MPVVWVQHSDDGLEHGSDGWRIVPELEPDPSEPLVESYGRSFEDTRLEDVLAEHDVGRLLVTGAQTDACTCSTSHGVLARDLRERRAHHRGPVAVRRAAAGAGNHPHTNLSWTYQTAPGRTAGTVPTEQVSFG